MIILANAVTHYVLFRHRLHYLSHAAFCLFVATSPLLGNTRGRRRRRTLAAEAVAMIALAASILWANSMLSDQLGVRMNKLAALANGGDQRSGPVVDQVLQRYGR
jgi:hypothetical protein